MPPYFEQKSIAKLLSSFDEKIELLREQNEIFETLAQTIFKEWFVNFNYLGSGTLVPHCALGGAKAPLPMNQMIDSELGDIPKGWDAGNVGRKGTMGAVVWCDNNFFPIDTTFYVEGNMGVESLYFHYFLLKKQNFERLGSYSAVPGLNRNSVYIIDTVIPAKICIT